VAAAQPDAPLVYDEAPGNLVLDYHYGDADAVAQAFARAAHVARLRLINNRLVVNAMEPRGCIAEYDAASGRWTITLGCQGVMGMRAQIADVLGVPPQQVHVLTYNTGGSFGMKGSVYPEYVCA